MTKEARAAALGFTTAALLALGVPALTAQSADPASALSLTSTAHPPLPSDPDLRMATTHNLVDVILGAAPNGSPAETGWRTVELLDAAYRSAARQGQAVWVRDLYSEEAAA